MDTIPNPAPACSPPIYWVGECHFCNRTHTADRDDVFRFMRTAWPACCGYTMIFRIVHGDPPLAELVE
jgi:hypothetical protein